MLTIPWGGIISLLKEKVTLLLAFGAIFLAAGITSGRPLVALDSYGRIVAIIAGALLVGTSLYILFHDINIGTSPAKIKRRLDLKVLHDSPSTMVGSYKKFLSSDQLYLIGQDEMTRLYYPIAPVSVNEDNMSWKASGQKRADAHGNRTRHVCWLGPIARNWVECHDQCLYQTGVSIGFRKLPDDCIPLVCK